MFKRIELHKSFLMILLCFVIQQHEIHAQFQNIRFENVSVKYGLPNGYIKDIIEDQYGFLWVGTREGIFRYDGYEFKAYRHDVLDDHSLSHPNVNKIISDKDGEIWIGTNSGLSLLDRRTGRFQNHFISPKNQTTTKINNLIRGLFEDSRGNFWIAGNTNILSFDKEASNFKSLDESAYSKINHSVRCFYEDAKGNVWAGTSKGLLILEPEQTNFKELPLEINEKYSRNIVGIHEAKPGVFWLGTQGGLILWDSNSNAIEHKFLPVALGDIKINFLMVDQAGNPWVALDNKGLGVYDIQQKKFHHYTYQSNQQNSLSSNMVSCILEDQFHNIWIGTENGISKIRLENSGFELLQNVKDDGNPANNINRLMQDSKGIIWSKTKDGFYYIESQETNEIRFNEPLKLQSRIGYDWFLEDHEGSIWLSSTGSGIYRKPENSAVFSKVNLSTTLSESLIYRMYVDRKDQDVFWIGTSLGLCRLNSKTLEEKWYRPLDDIPQISSNTVSIFDQHGADEIWLYYTYSNSLGRFNKHTEKFDLFLPGQDKEPVLEGDVKDIAVGDDGNVWLATLYGLTNFNIATEAFEIFGKREGSLENELQSVIVDHEDRVWVCGNRFFARFDHQNKQFINYQNAKDVLHFQSKSKDVAPNGNILFGSINGIYSFHPDRIYKNQRVPEIVLTGFKVKTESFLLEDAFEDAKKIKLSHNQNDITFEFSALHYIDPKNNNYKCKLEGFDQEWRELGHEHKLSYTNLNPGTYYFQVIASNSDGVWNEEGLQIQLDITPAYWQTNAFKGIIILGLIALIYAFFKNRQHQFSLKRQKEIAEKSSEYKTQFLADVSHEIRTPMNAIIGLSKLTLETKLDKRQNKFIRAIQQSSQNLLSIINDLLDHTKLESGNFSFTKKQFDLSNITDQIRNTFSHELEDKQLSFDILVDPTITNKLYGDPLRLNQILINLIGNAFKFTNLGNIWLHIKKGPEDEGTQSLTFEVGDTGIGIPIEKLESIFENFKQVESSQSNVMPGTGLGLSIAKQLVERQGGQLSIKSEIGRGTKLWFDLKFGKSNGKDQIQPAETNNYHIDTLNILVVEDTYFNQMLLIEVLNKHIKKANIVIAENGQIALNKLAVQDFDLILMDVKMPVLDGFETTKRIRKLDDKKLRSIPIIAVTASAVSEQLQKCKDAGMDDYVTKPIDENELMKKVFSLTQSETL